MFSSKKLASNYRGPFSSLSAGFLSKVTDNGFEMHMSPRSRQEEMPPGRLHTEFEPTTSGLGVQHPNHWVLPLITRSNETFWIHDFLDCILSVRKMHAVKMVNRMARG